jgi:aminopeptidase N
MVQFMNARRQPCLRTIARTIVVAFALVPGGPAWAEPGFSFATAPGKLPKTVVPTHYAIELEPDLDRLTIAGTEVIDIEVREPTGRIVLNALNLTLTRAAIETTRQNAAITIDRASETATLSFAQPLSAGAYKLRVDFTGVINKFGRGLFVTDYKTAQGGKRMLASHLEPADARRIFPSFDEPAFKATFALTVTLPRAFTAISNMPVAHEEPVTPTLKQVTFAATPRMSSYLFALAAGEFERLSGQADGTTVSVVTVAGKSAQGRFALDSAVELLHYFNDYFGLKYPLPKLDLIALPGGFGGAMENWGAVTFFESLLLFDPATGAESARRRIFAVVAHELAHQWFGNLVTMGWWDNLWLNEGFASWMERKAAEQLYPQWQAWLNGSAGKQRVLDIDARRTSRPLQRPVANESEAMAAFDAITYGKGQALIRMIENWLGERTFRDGIRRYLSEHAYGNTTTADLWRALEAASGQPVASVAGTFTEQAGVPLVRGEAACIGGEQRITLRQERFSIRDPNAATRRWQIPVTIGALRALRPSETVLLQDQPKEVTAGACGEPVKLNFGDIGYYRVQYDDASRAALARSLRLMSAADRLNLLADAWAMVEASRAPPSSYFELIEEIGADDSSAVWEQVIAVLSRLDRLERGRPEHAAFRAYARGKLRPAFDRLGWDGPEGDDAPLLRARLIRTLGEIGDPDVLAEARRRFDALARDGASPRPALREPVIALAGLAADRATYDALIARARNASDASERVRFYLAAASARDPALASETLARTLTDELPANLIGRTISAVAEAGEQPELALGFVLKNFDALANRQGPTFRTTFVSNFMTVFSDAARAEELKNFAPAHATSGGRIVAARAIETIMTKAEFKADVLPAIDDWIKARGAKD